MNGRFLRLLSDLRPARKAVGDDSRRRGSVSDSRKQRMLAASDGDVVMTGFESPRARKSATSAADDLDLHSCSREELPIAIDAAGRLLVAMTP